MSGVNPKSGPGDADSVEEIDLLGVGNSGSTVSTALAETASKEDAAGCASTGLGLRHPFFLCDVAVMARERACTMREDIPTERRKIWKLEAKDEGASVAPLPCLEPGSSPTEVRLCLKYHQKNDPKLEPIVDELDRTLDRSKGNTQEALFQR